MMILIIVAGFTMRGLGQVAMSSNRTADNQASSLASTAKGVRAGPNVEAQIHRRPSKLILNQKSRSGRPIKAQSSGADALH